MTNKLVVGLAQADQKYGFNKHKKFSDVIDLCLKNNLLYFDSSNNYKNSKLYEDIIFKNKNTKVITKSSFNYPLNTEFKKNVEIELSNLLLNKNFYALLIHDPLLPSNKKKWKIVYTVLKKFKKKGFFKKIGISVYNKYELSLILKNFKPDIVQFPINVFNQSFNDLDLLKSLKKKKIELHARSIFLQGLLLKKYKNLDNFFDIWIDDFKNFENFTIKNKISRIEACILFVLKNKYIDKFIIGIDDKTQFNEIISTFNKIKTHKNIDFSNLKSFDQNLIDPRYWTINKKNKYLKNWVDVKKIVLNGSLLLSKRPEQFLPGGWPSFYKKAKSCFVWDQNNRKFLDFSLMGVGTNILGYSNKKINNELKKNLDKGNISTLNSNYDYELTKKLLSLHPWSGMATYARTGGEANSIAIRISRVFSKKDSIAICGYHGWHDWYLSANLKDKNSLNKIFLRGLNTLGIPKNLKGVVHPFKYNDIEGFKKLIKNNPDIGTVFMEVQRNEKPRKNFLKIVRSITKKKGLVLIFDECTSGFRENYGGLHLKYKLNPDIAVFGKSLGNGIPITAIIGKKKIMEPSSNSFISSTFWTDSTGPAAAIATLNQMKQIKSWDKIVKIGKKIKKFWQIMSKKYNVAIKISGLDSMPLFNFKDDLNLYYKTFITQELLKRRILATNSVYCCVDHEKYLEKYFKEFELVFSKIAYIKKNESILNNLEFPVSMPGFERLN